MNHAVVRRGKQSNVHVNNDGTLYYRISSDYIRHDCIRYIYNHGILYQIFSFFDRDVWIFYSIFGGVLHCTLLLADFEQPKNHILKKKALYS